MLTLLKQTDQENWPIIPSLLGRFGGRYPTIAMWRESLQKDSQDGKTRYSTIVHGVYALEFELTNLNTLYEGESYIKFIFDSKEIDIKVTARLDLWLKGFALGNVVYNGSTITVIGKFVKNGQVVAFIPLQEKF